MIAKDTSCNIQRAELIICPDALSGISCRCQDTSIEIRRLTILVSHTVGFPSAIIGAFFQYTSRTNQNEHEGH
jgi:hypothetical protein